LEEAALSGVNGHVVESGLVALPRLPPTTEPAFARQIFRIAGLAAGPDSVLALLTQALASSGRRPYAIVVTVPDSEIGNRSTDRACELEQTVNRTLALDPTRPRVSATELDPAGLLVEVCLLSDGRAVVGSMLAGEAKSLHPGGRRRLRREREAPSRAALKLEEAFEWLGRAPEKGERCADLGAAPGGWSHVLLARGARVWAVDPARLRPDLASHKNLHHLQRSAFDYRPDEPFDWVFCDMAWRPLEVAALLAKWARRGWAQALLSNIKLPMKQRAAMVARVRSILTEAGWQGLRVRQLYHDRDEVTLGGWRL
jgi:23S rRNA (cytidine2498-2'-O)-methyltransferase